MFDVWPSNLSKVVDDVEAEGSSLLAELPLAALRLLERVVDLKDQRSEIKKAKYNDILVRRKIKDQKGRSPTTSWLGERSKIKKAEPNDVLLSGGKFECRLEIAREIEDQ